MTVPFCLSRRSPRRAIICRISDPLGVGQILNDGAVIVAGGELGATKGALFAEVPGEIAAGNRHLHAIGIGHQEILQLKPLVDEAVTQSPLVGRGIHDRQACLPGTPVLEDDIGGVVRQVMLHEAFVYPTLGHQPIRALTKKQRDQAK